jgi:hypothetical protein
MKYEKTQLKNPHQLVVRQHVIPVRSIERFGGPDGCVEVNIGPENRVERLKPDNGIFCARRAWDQRAERGFMKQIEDGFQPLADRIVSGEVTEISASELPIVNAFFALWYHRSRIQPAEQIETQLNGVTGQVLTKDEQERLEAAHVLFLREGGKIATRHIVGIELQSQIDAYCLHFADQVWGIIKAPEGEFLMPDVPAHGLMPISPTILLASGHPSGLITKSNLVQVNTEFLAYTRRYFFGRSLDIALEGVTDVALQAAIIERGKKIAQGIVV